jgi:hypothetical protein
MEFTWVWGCYLGTLDHAFLVEHEEVAATVQHGTAFDRQIRVATVLLLLKTKNMDSVRVTWDRCYDFLNIFAKKWRF